MDDSCEVGTLGSSDGVDVPEYCSRTTGKVSMEIRTWNSHGKKSCESASVREGPEFGVTLDGWWAEVTPREDMGGMLMKVTVGVMAGRGRERWGRGKGRGVIAR